MNKSIAQPTNESKRSVPADESPGGVGNRASELLGGASGDDRKVGGGGRHLPLPPQLQRRPGHLLRLHQLLRLQTQEDLGKTLQTGRRRRRRLCVFVRVFVRAFVLARSGVCVRGGGAIKVVC